MTHGVLAGQRTIVIGGDSRIGFGSARLFADDGAVVSIAGRTVQKLETGLTRCDALDRGSVRKAVEASSDSGERLDDIAVVVPGDGSIGPIAALRRRRVQPAGRDELRTIPGFLRGFEHLPFSRSSRYWWRGGGQPKGEILCTANHLSECTNTVMYVRYEDGHLRIEDHLWRVSCCRDVLIQWTEAHGVSS